MFGEPVFSASRHVRAGGAQLFSEFVATFGLLCVIWGCARLRSSAVPFAVGAYITGAYWFTASTSFANPAVTLARSASDTFAGIRPADAPGFIVAQLAGAAAATLLFRWLVPSLPKDAASVVVSHSSKGKLMSDKKRVLILCTGNSARSQMAEGLLRHDAGDRFDVESAGTKASSVRPEAIAAMRELGIDISGHRSKHVDEFEGQQFDYVITVATTPAKPARCSSAQRSNCITALKTRPRRSSARKKNGWRSFGAFGMSCGPICAISPRSDDPQSKPI